jgi:phenylpropionate dioxygenase-like ring-hydroxylating dioxygenase large terminal subunit
MICLAEREEEPVTEVLPTQQGRIWQTLVKLLRNGTTDQCDEVVAVQPEEFTDPAIAARERELVFGRVPSIVCHGAEIPRPGDFLTVQMPRNKVIVVRQRDGSVKSLLNHCRHRGALLEQRERGRCRLFSCRYHGWSYNPDGTLRTVSEDSTFGDVNRAQHSLIELPTEERHGLVWLVDEATASIDVADWLGEAVDEMLAGYRMDRLITFRSAGYDEPVNWKIMQDAFIDNYHLKYAHPNTAGKAVHSNVLAVEDFGRHARMIAPRKSIDRVLNDDPAADTLAKHVIDGLFLLPNSTFARLPDHDELLTFRPHPSDAGRCRMEMRLLVPTVEDSGMDDTSWQELWEKNWAILQAVLYEEDFPLLRGSQTAMGSANAGPMLLGRNEVVNQIFRRELRKLTS